MGAGGGSVVCGDDWTENASERVWIVRVGSGETFLKIAVGSVFPTLSWVGREFGVGELVLVFITPKRERVGEGEVCQFCCGREFNGGCCIF